jgi:glutamine phosphoribosylpyrophosphate amidotransferase
MKLSLTLTDGVSAQTTLQVIERARKAGARDVHALFPDAPLPELKRFYMIDVPDQLATDMINELRDLNGVESIEPGRKRKPL